MFWWVGFKSTPTKTSEDGLSGPDYLLSSAYKKTRLWQTQSDVIMPKFPHDSDQKGKLVRDIKTHLETLLSVSSEMPLRDSGGGDRTAEGREVVKVSVSSQIIYIYFIYIYCRWIAFLISHKNPLTARQCHEMYIHSVKCLISAVNVFNSSVTV